MRSSKRRFTSFPATWIRSIFKGVSAALPVLYLSSHLKAEPPVTILFQFWCSEDVKEEEKEASSQGESECEGEDADEHFYDKKSSFFDKISCEALEREEG